MSETSEIEHVSENGFDILRARLLSEYLENMFRFGSDAPRMDELELLNQQVMSRIDEVEVYTRGYYFAHGRKVASDLIVHALEAGIDNNALTEFVRTQLTWELPYLPTISDICGASFITSTGDDIPLLSPQQVIKETMDGLNHRIAEHLGIE